jgi:hypothetical protein
MTVRVAIDLNVRVKGNQAMAGFEDASGMVAMGDEVEVYEPESGLHGPAVVNEIDDSKRLIYMITDWRALRLPPDSPEMAAYQQASNEIHDLTGD